jgi:hypothetical protein
MIIIIIAVILGFFCYVWQDDDRFDDNFGMMPIRRFIWNM